jgi:DNA adenine methylase
LAKPIIPWIGGKRRLAKQILPLFPDHTCYVEPFCGGAALFFMKVPSKVEVLNDLNGDVVNLYRVVTHHLDEFVRQFRWALSSRETFLHHQVTDVRALTDVQRAARFFYLQKMCFGARVEEKRFGAGKTFSADRTVELLDNARQRLQRTVIENLDWRACTERYDRAGTLFFLDPPYWQTEGYGVPFGFEQYELMASMAKSAKGNVLITVNDHPDMRRAFEGLRIRTVDIRYTVGGAARSDVSTELILTNF